MSPLLSGCGGSEAPLAVRWRDAAVQRAQARANVEASARTECAKDAWRCAESGYHYFLGADVPRDEARARAMFERGCAADDERACPFLGYALLSGRGGPRDEERGLALLHRACRAGNANGYGYLGLAHEEGLGGLAKNPALAASYYMMGCNEESFLYGSALACARLAAMFEEGRGVPRSDYWAGYLFHKGCNVDDPEAARLACLRGAALFERGGFPPGVFYDGLPETAKPYSRVARELRERACLTGQSEACPANLEVR